MAQYSHPPSAKLLYNFQQPQPHARLLERQIRMLISSTFLVACILSISLSADSDLHGTTSHQKHAENGICDPLKKKTISINNIIKKLIFERQKR